MKHFVPFSQFLAYAKSLKGEEMIALEFAEHGYTVTTRLRVGIAEEARVEERDLSDTRPADGSTPSPAPISARLEDKGQLAPCGKGGDSYHPTTPYSSLAIIFQPETTWITKIGYNCPVCEYPCQSGEPCFLCGKMQSIADKARENRRNYAILKSAERAVEGVKMPYNDL
jgi:hypothetical protein